MKVNLEHGSLYARPARVQVTRPAAKAEGPQKSGSGNGLGSRFADAFAEVEKSAKASDKAADDLVAGEIDLHDALVQMEKADLTLKLGTTVRNKLLDAYQQLMSSAGG